MMRSVRLARSLSAALLLLLPLNASASPPTKKPTPRYGFPRLAPGQLWVSSVPIGLEVHAGDSPMPQKVLGRTPLVLNARDVNRYVTITIQKKEFGRDLPNIMGFLDFSSRATHSNIWQGENERGEKVEEDRSRAITYDLRLPDKPTIIALFQTREHTPADLDRLYPPGSNFRFSDQALRRRLAKKGVPADFIASGIQLLHRGGKVILPSTQGGGLLIAEVTYSGSVELLDSPSSPAK
jgi:hypothetical protein